MSGGVVAIEAVLVGRAAPFARRGVRSAIAKQRVMESIPVGPTGFLGDEQGDRRHHGGPEKAVHHYALDHYDAWRAELMRFRFNAPGAFGENLSTTGLTERNVCLGDIWRAGTALLQVSQARQPCWKLNDRFGVPDMARRVQESGRTGWYYRVLKPGQVAPGSLLKLVERPHCEWPLSRLLHCLYIDPMNRSALEEIAQLPTLSESWRLLVRRRLTRGAVENWRPRLEGLQH